MNLKKTKTRVFSLIFGFLASLAITNALRTYYDGYIKELSLTLPTLINGVSDNFVSTLLLIDFFIVAIPLTHAGYLFLSSLNIDNVKKNIQRNSSSGFIAIFIISIIQVAFLFFLANSITNVEKPEDISIQSLQSQLFIFWLTLTAMMAGAGSILVKIIMKQNRIPIEWVLLYAFLVGFLITMSLTIFVSNSLGNEQGLQLFNVTLLVVLLIRAALDYVIGQRIYFPKSS